MGGLPYFATGSGPPLVVLGGLAPDTGVESDSAVRMNSGFVKPFATRRRVHFFNRRPGLPRGMTMADLASEHADALREGFGAPVDLFGMSTGGSIAQQLAADHPDVVRRLVIVSSACRLGSNGRELQRRVAARIRGGASRQAFAVMAAGLVPRHRGRLPAALLAWLLAPHLADPDDLADMATTIEAEDGFDLAACDSAIAAPTLLVAGGRDVFYERELFDETARLIPGSRLSVHERRGHATVTMRRDVGPEILRFLDG
jgi:pimeloyl-ACP methyl ester carboxylesterase